MKRLIGSRVYDTKRAMVIAEEWNIERKKICRYFGESLCRTKNGEYFIFAYDGPLSEYCVLNDQMYDTDMIQPISEELAYRWLRIHNEIDVIAEFFKDK